MNSNRLIDNIFYDQFGNYVGSKIAGLIKLMQMNYDMRGISAIVSGSNNEVKVNLQSSDIVGSYNTLTKIINNPQSYSASDVQTARSAIDKMKSDISSSTHRTKQDRDMFIDAKVSKVTFSIGGQHLVSVSIT